MNVDMKRVKTIEDVAAMGLEAFYEQLGTVIVRTPINEGNMEMVKQLLVFAGTQIGEVTVTLQTSMNSAYVFVIVS